MVNKVWTPTDKQRKVMEILNNADHPLTLEEISNAYGEAVASGSINALVKKGYIGHGEDCVKEVVVKRKVKTYKVDKPLA